MNSAPYGSGTMMGGGNRRGGGMAVGTKGGGRAMLGNPGGGREKSGADCCIGGFSIAAGSGGCASCSASSMPGDAGEMPDSGRLDDRLPPPITSIAPAILRAGGGPAFFTATDPAYFEFSLTTDIGRGAAGIVIYSKNVLGQYKKKTRGKST